MTLSELATILKLSPATVSRALNGYPEVNAKTRSRVLQAAKEHNYHPSHHAKQLATGKSYSIGHVLNLDDHKTVNPNLSDFIAGACPVYSKAGYDMLMQIVSNDAEEETYRKLAKNGRVDAVMVLAPRKDDYRIELLQSLDLPFLVHGRCHNSETKDYNWIDVNNYNGFKRAAKHLIDLGHENIAIINGPERNTFARDRLQGYLDALEDANLSINPKFISACDPMTEIAGHTVAGKMLSQSIRPTAFLSSNMLLAYGTKRAIDDASLILGKDTTIIAWDDQLSYLDNGENVPLFTSLRSSITKAGTLCANALLDIIANPEQAPKNILLEADFIIGDTMVAPAKK